MFKKRYGLLCLLFLGAPLFGGPHKEIAQQESCEEAPFENLAPENSSFSQESKAIIVADEKDISCNQRPTAFDRAKNFLGGFAFHVEYPKISFDFKNLQFRTDFSSVSPAWIAYYATLAKTFGRYAFLRMQQARGAFDHKNFSNLSDAYSDERIADMQMRFREVLKAVGSPLADHLRIFVGTTVDPGLAFTAPFQGTMFCAREIWYSDPELAEVIMLHELGHLVDPVNRSWLAEVEGLFPAVVTATAGFALLQLMNHKALRGVTKYPIAGVAVGSGLLVAEHMLFQKGVWRYRTEMYADTFAAEHIADPRSIQKMIDWLDLYEGSDSSWLFKIPGAEYFLKRFVAGYPSWVKRRKNLEDIMKRRLQEEGRVNKWLGFRAGASLVS